MDAGTRKPGDPFAETLRAAHAMMRSGHGEEACQLLARSKEGALLGGKPEAAALYSSVRGSYLVALGRDSEALAAYLEAERLSGDDAHYQLGTARHLVFGMQQPARALDKVSLVLESPSGGPAVQHEARAIRGLALLALDQPEKAIEELRTLCSELSSARLPSLSCDLTLVEEISRRRLAPELCERYADSVEARARDEKEDRVLDRLLQIRSLSTPDPGSA